MQRWQESLQILGRVVPRVLGVLLIAGAALAGLYQWKSPELVQLREKDAYRYEQMVRSAARFHWIDAWRQYSQLKEIGLAQLHRERYARWKRQWRNNAGFRQKVMQEKAETRKELKASHEKKYRQDAEKLRQLRQKPEAALLKVSWEQATPWQKSLILRDGCIRYLSRELEDHRQRPRVKEALHGAALLAHSRISQAGPGVRCREIVPLHHDEPSVHRSLLELRDRMNYYYFSRLLADIGIPDSELFTVQEKLDGMTRDFNGF